MDDAEMTLSGSAFQTLAVATEKGRLPVVDVLKDGSTSWLVAVDRSVYRCDTHPQCHGEQCNWIITGPHLIYLYRLCKMYIEKKPCSPSNFY